METRARLESEIELGWALSSVRVVSRIDSYPGRVVHVLESDQGTFAAKVFADEELVSVISGLDVLIAVRAGGFPHAPEVRRTCAGDPAGLTTDGPTTLLEYVPLPSGPVPTPDVWAEIAHALACLNTLPCARDFAVPVAAALRDQLESPPSHEYATGIAILVQRLLHLGAVPSDGVVHGEANLSNVARRGSGELALLDWDQAGMAPAALDYGYPLITCFISEDLVVDEANIRTFYDAYRSSGRGVDPQLALDAGLFHALRYMWFANTPARWDRIQFALRHQDDLLGLIG